MARNDKEIRIDADSNIPQEMSKASKATNKLSKDIEDLGRESKRASDKVDRLNDKLNQTNAINKKMGAMGNTGFAGQAQKTAAFLGNATTQADKLNTAMNKVHQTGLRIMETFGAGTQAKGFGFFKGNNTLPGLIYPTQQRADQALASLRKYQRELTAVRQNQVQIARLNKNEVGLVSQGGDILSRHPSERNANARLSHLRDRVQLVRAARASHLYPKEGVSTIPGAFTGVETRFKSGKTFSTHASVAEAEGFLSGLKRTSDIYRTGGTVRKMRGGGYGIMDSDGVPFRTFTGVGAKRAAESAQAQMKDRGRLLNAIGSDNFGASPLKGGGTLFQAFSNRGKHMPAFDRVFGNKAEFGNFINNLQTESAQIKGIRGRSKIGIHEIFSEGTQAASGRFGMWDPKTEKFLGGRSNFASPAQAQAYQQSINRMGGMQSFVKSQDAMASPIFGSSKIGYSVMDEKGNVLYSAKTRKAAEDYKRNAEANARSMDKQEKASKKLTDENRRQGVSFLQLTKLMLQFGLAMEIINLPFRVAGLAGSVVSTGARMEQELAHIRALTTISKPEMTGLGESLLLSKLDYPVQGNVLQSAEEIASSLATITPSLPGMFGNAEAQTIYDVQKAAMQYAVGVNVDILPATQTVASIMTATKINAAEFERWGDTLAKTVDVGRITPEVTSKIAGEQIGLVTNLWPDDPERQYREFTDLMTAVATMSNTLDQGFLVSATTNLMRGMWNPSPSSREFMGRLKDLGYNLTEKDLVGGGLRKWLAEYQNAVGPQGELISKWIGTPKGQELTAEYGEDKARSIAASAIMAEIFEDIRQIRAMQALAAGNWRMLGDAQHAFDTETAGSLGRQSAIRTDTLATEFGKTKSLWEVIQFALFNETKGGLFDFVDNLNDEFEKLVKSKLFENAPIDDKIVMLFDKGLDLLENWLNGGGAEKMAKVFGIIIDVLFRVFNFLFVNPQFITFLNKLGHHIGMAVVSGVWEGVKQAGKSFFDIKPSLDYSASLLGQYDTPRMIAGFRWSDTGKEQFEALKNRQEIEFNRIPGTLDPDMEAAYRNPNDPYHDKAKQIVKDKTKEFNIKWRAIFDQFLKEELRRYNSGEYDTSVMSEEELNKILDTRNYSPSSSNSEQFNITIVVEGDMTDETVDKVATAFADAVEGSETPANAVSDAHHTIRTQSPTPTPTPSRTPTPVPN